jgi:hypothetical protein
VGVPGSFHDDGYRRADDLRENQTVMMSTALVVPSARVRQGGLASQQRGESRD